MMTLPTERGYMVSLSTLRILPALLALLLSCSISTWGVAESHSVGKIFSLQGTVQVQRQGALLAASVGGVLQPGDELIVGEPGRVAVELPDGSYVRVGSGARLRLGGDDQKLGLIEGALHFLSHAERHPTFETATVTAAIRGTEFTMVASAHSTAVFMLSGALEGQSNHGRVSLTAGQGGRFRSGSAPEVFALRTDDRKVQWSMFVPLGVDFPGAPAQPVQLFNRGEVRAALDLLGSDPRDPCAATEVLRARILLASGDPITAASIFERCRHSSSSTPQRAEAIATLALMSLLQSSRTEDRRKEALLLASEAAAVAADSVAVRLVQSFIAQEQGDLALALQLVADHPERAPQLRARYAEVLFMFGRVPEARKIMESLTERSWYTESVYGFILLADRESVAAERTFEAAAELEPAAGLPRLGLGIVRAGRGDIAGARQEFERATVLEPMRALYRSYLAKSYFEDDQYERADPEYTRAIELDPNDPTPYLYRSFMRVARNDLVGALADIEDARRRSDARDVYRSSFLLDQDSAMQSASVARVYQQLGFKERGRVEAITAISQDYRNATAHRLLSQTQESLFNADTIASEQRISRLFAPLSVNVVDSIGTGVSLNEYSQLLERDGSQTAVVSAFNSKSDEFRMGVLSAYKDTNLVTALSADGAAYNGVADDPRSSAGTIGWSVQAQPSWGDRVLFEGRALSSGNTTMEQSADDLSGTINLAYLHSFAPESSIVFNSSYDRSRATTNRPLYQQPIAYTQITDGAENTDIFSLPLDQRSQRYETTVVNEAQLLTSTRILRSILTLRQAHSQLDSFDSSVVTLDQDSGDSAPLYSSGGVNLNSSSASYLGTLTIARSLQLNFGGEYEHLEWADRDEAPFTSGRAGRDLLSPKAGLVYRPDPGVALRIGYGESLGKGVRTDLSSIEPTLIGGITQRYNDLPGTRSQNLGFGGDFKPSEGTFFGAEWTRRWLDESQSVSLYNLVDDTDAQRSGFDVASADRYDVPITQDLISAYLYQVLSRQWVAGLDCRSVAEAIAGDESSALRDYRATLFTRYFLQSGFFVHATSSYRYQNRRNTASDAGDSINGSDAAFLCGAGVGYRLPHRKGLLTLDLFNVFGQDSNLAQRTYFNEPVFNDPTALLSVQVNF